EETDYSVIPSSTVISLPLIPHSSFILDDQEHARQGETAMDTSSDNTAVNEDASIHPEIINPARPQDSAASTQSSQLDQPGAEQPTTPASVTLAAAVSTRAPTV
ncbi:hypothetical protein EDD11_009127, partial [Mortierella claussenii]